MMHYLEFLDRLGLKQVNLVGFSMGGRFAATFAYEHRPRVKKLVLVAPAGLDAPGYPMADLSKVPPAEVPAYLTEDLSVLLPHLPKQPSPEWQAARAREGANFFGLLDTGLVGGNFPRWLHRLTMPTLLLWGEKDRITPFAQAEAWMNLLPNAQLRRFAGAGHLLLDERREAVEEIAEFLGME
jgi:pimeloyl-ACP methyl ester carboxylesterase